MEWEGINIPILIAETESVANLDSNIDIWDHLHKISRCCGRCDGEYDICVADMVCEQHNEIGCENCYGKR